MRIHENKEYKRIVITRKLHDCYYCLDNIPKGSSAWLIEPYRRAHHHICIECQVTIEENFDQIIDQDESELQRGCVKQWLESQE